MNEFILILILILIFFYINQNLLVEMFTNVYQSYQYVAPQNMYNYSYYPYYQQYIQYPLNSIYNLLPISNGYTNFPWWNTSLGMTKNMSYDLRGDPLSILPSNLIWNNPRIYPISNYGI
jgi:hypothetical protein